jgi:hypothetical protein
LCLIVLALCAVCGCVSGPRLEYADDEIAGEGGAGGTVVNWPFVPRSLRIHPLTHMDISVDGGESVLVLHAELRDRYGDSVKGLGRMRVELSRSVTGSIAPGAESRAAWDVTDMDEPESSSRRYDPATRTYRVPLRTPAWVTRWMLDERERRGGPQRLTLRVSFTPTVGSGGRVLTDEFGLEP